METISFIQFTDVLKFILGARYDCYDLEEILALYQQFLEEKNTPEPNATPGGWSDHKTY